MKLSHKNKLYYYFMNFHFNGVQKDAREWYRELQITSFEKNKMTFQK